MGTKTVMGTPEDKGREILNQIFTSQHNDDKSLMILLSTREIAVIMVHQIIAALESHGENFGIIGDMDSEWRYWDKVLEFIKSV